jgi:hypothetical protein
LLKINKKYLIFLLIISISLVFFFTKDSKYYIKNNSKTIEFNVPLYLKLYNFYGRHLNYSYIVKQITKESKSDIEKVVHISKWIQDNIKKIPKGVDTIDSHPFTIMERRLGEEYQFSDLLSVLLVYAGIDAFMWYPEENYLGSITVFNVNGRWSIIDPYYGIFFIKNKKHISITELKGVSADIGLFAYNFNYEKINSNNIGEKFSKNNDTKEPYKNYINKLPTEYELNSSNKFDLGDGRSYLQSPFGKLKYMIHKF